MPNVYIDNLSFAERIGIENVNVFCIENKDETNTSVDDFSKDSFDNIANKNPYTPPKIVVVKNNRTDVIFSIDNNEFFKNTNLINN